MTDVSTTRDWKLLRHVHSIGTRSCVGSSSRGRDKSAATRGVRASRRSLNATWVNQKCRICRSSVKSSFKTPSQRCLVRGVYHTRWALALVFYSILSRQPAMSHNESRTNATQLQRLSFFQSSLVRWDFTTLRRGQHFTAFILDNTDMETKLVVVTVCLCTSHFCVSITGIKGECMRDTSERFCGLFKSCCNLVHCITPQWTFLSGVFKHYI